MVYSDGSPETAVTMYLPGEKQSFTFSDFSSIYLPFRPIAELDAPA